MGKRWVNGLKKIITTPALSCSFQVPFKGYNDDVSKADVIFISVHIPTEKNGTQNLKLLKEIINNLPEQKPIFVRTTILPGTTDWLCRETKRQVHFMPEFLTERTAYADFCEQPMVFTAETELLRQIFVGKKYIEMTSLEAEIAKYAHNVFGALKVTYFNGIYALCQKMGANYPKVQQGVLLSGYINAQHTMVQMAKQVLAANVFQKMLALLTTLTKTALWARC